MAFAQISMYSEALAMDTDVCVLLPEHRRGGRAGGERRTDHPVLYCLHGHGDDHTAWIRKSNIELVARRYDLIVVMPTVQRGYYVNGRYGLAYETYIADELPRKMRDFLHISARREDTFVMGNSMGGYGALRMALRHPERYAACCALSPALPQTFAEHDPSLDEFARGIRLAMGPLGEIGGTDNDVLTLADRLDAAAGPQPRICVCCGSEDELAGESFALLDGHVRESCPHLCYESELAAGGHDWQFWNPRIERFVTSLGLQSIRALEG